MQIEQIATDILLFRGESYESLATAFVDGDRVLLIDALASEDDAAAMRAHLEDTLGLTVAVIVLTHCFTDHMAGVTLFPAAEVVAQRLFMYTFLEKGDRPLQQRQEFVVPTSVVDQQCTVRWGRYMLDIFHNPGKTVCSLGIDVPAADILFVGDNIVGNIGYIGGSAPELIDEAIGRLECRGRRRVIPGHMGVQDARALSNARRYLAKLRERVLHIRQVFQPQEAALAIREIAVEACAAEEVALSSFERHWHSQNLNRIVERQLFSCEYRPPSPVRSAELSALSCSGSTTR